MAENFASKQEHGQSMARHVKIMASAWQDAYRAHVKQKRLYQNKLVTASKRLSRQARNSRLSKRRSIAQRRPACLTNPGLRWRPGPGYSALRSTCLDGCLLHSGRGVRFHTNTGS